MEKPVCMGLGSAAVAALVSLPAGARIRGVGVKLIDRGK